MCSERHVTGLDLGKLETELFHETLNFLHEKEVETIIRKNTRTFFIIIIFFRYQCLRGCCCSRLLLFAAVGGKC